MVKPLLCSMSLLRASGSRRCFHPLVMNTTPTMTRKRSSATSANRANSGNSMYRLYGRHQPHDQDQKKVRFAEVDNKTERRLEVGGRRSEIRDQLRSSRAPSGFGEFVSAQS